MKDRRGAVLEVVLLDLDSPQITGQTPICAKVCVKCCPFVDKINDGPFKLGFGLFVYL